MVWKWVVPFVLLSSGCPFEHGGFVFDAPGHPSKDHRQAP